MLPMVDLQRQYKQLKSEIDEALEEVLKNAQFILGPNVSKLEEEVARGEFPAPAHRCVWDR